MTDHLVLEIAHDLAGLPIREASLLREGENSVWRVGTGVIARISPSGDVERIERELRIARWLASEGFPAVRPVAGARQPIEVEGSVVTFWEDFGPHEKGSPSQVALLLRKLHSLSLPTAFDPGVLDPFVRLETRIWSARRLEAASRDWLLNWVRVLQERWDQFPRSTGVCLIHGDAWVGNIASLPSGETLLLDLERSSVGPPEWDLVSTAIKLTSFGWISDVEYDEFCRLYGQDVTESEHFELLRDLRELRMATYALYRANFDPDLSTEAAFRLSCLRDREGPRPWAWTATG